MKRMVRDVADPRRTAPLGRLNPTPAAALFSHFHPSPAPPPVLHTHPISPASPETLKRQRGTRPARRAYVGVAVARNGQSRRGTVRTLPGRGTVAALGHSGSFGPGANGSACAGRMGEISPSISAARQMDRIIWLAERNCSAAVQASCKEGPCARPKSRRSLARPSRIQLTTALSVEHIRTSASTLWNSTINALHAWLGPSPDRPRGRTGHKSMAETGCKTASRLTFSCAPFGVDCKRHPPWPSLDEGSRSTWEFLAQVPINSSESGLCFHWPRVPAAEVVATTPSGSANSQRTVQRRERGWMKVVRTRACHVAPLVSRVSRRPSHSSSRPSRVYWR